MIAILGDFNPAFPTHLELQAEVTRVETRTNIEWIDTDSKDAVLRAARGTALWVIPGTPYKRDDVVYSAIKNARLNNQPFLGSCGGFQYAAIEYARNVAGIDQAEHAEIEPDAKQRVIEPLHCSLIAKERQVRTVAGTRLAKICGIDPFTGYHYCNYGLSAEYTGQLADAGIVFNSYADDAGVEGFELPNHVFFVATLFQPQVGAIASRAQHPLIKAFVDATTS